MRQSVGDDKQRHVQLEVVGCDLVEDLLVDSDLRRLIFYDSNGLQLIVEDYRIASFFHGIDINCNFVSDKRNGKLFFFGQKLHHILAHPLFWSQGDEFFSAFIEDGAFACFVFHPKIIFRKIKFCHFSYLCELQLQK